MGYDLENDKGESVWLSIQQMSSFFKIAEDFGWQPMGTQYNQTMAGFYLDPCCDLEEEQTDELTVWDGGYFTNEDQIIIAEDAHNLANALKLAMNKGAIPDNNFCLEIIQFFEVGSVIIS